MTKDKKITSFFSKQQHAPQIPRSSSRQASIRDLKKVVRLPKAGVCADDGELLRLLDCLKSHTSSCAEASNSSAANSTGNPDSSTSAVSSSSTSIEQLVLSLRQLACYTITIEQLERVPLAKQVKTLRQHADPDVQRLASRLVEKLRNETAATTAIRRQKQRKQNSSLRSMLASSKGTHDAQR